MSRGKWQAIIISKKKWKKTANEKWFFFFEREKMKIQKAREKKKVEWSPLAAAAAPARDTRKYRSV